MALNAVSEKKQTSLFTENLTVKMVFDSLDSISKASGRGSQELKMKLFAKLLELQTETGDELDLRRVFHNI